MAGSVFGRADSLSVNKRYLLDEWKPPRERLSYLNR